MAVKTITITIKAYDMLANLKGPKDSFSDVIIENLGHKGRSPLWDLVGILSNEEADEMEKNIMETRKRWTESTRKRGAEIAAILDARKS